ncbi:FAD-dependent oxidoreductase [Alicyclobacillus macrosporangiidus]|uniref:Thioredoxin reductase n=1 Tax=Alicyclobacillus macrosporangiidus TaxID=392015 RepID=A0A1I7LCR9_9BACL|nr:Thioredoxin reductase [Alicyclobacillus macrosporangiidus]
MAIRNPSVDVAVVGGGIAGLAAAKEAAQSGLRVALFEEMPVLGGRAACRTEWVIGPEGPVRLYEWVSRLTHEVKSFGCEVYVNTPVIEVTSGRLVAIPHGCVCELEATTIVVATGARAQSLPFPGWSRPGVMTGDAVRSLIVRDRVLPGSRVVIVGLTDEALWTARELLLAGAQWVTLVGADHPAEEVAGVRVALDVYLAGLAERSGERTGIEGSGSEVLLNSLHEIPPRLYVRPDWVIKAAHGQPNVREVMVVHREDGATETVPCDLVVVCHAHSPALEVLQLAGVQFVYALPLGGWTPVYGPDMQTTIPGIYAAGGAAGADTPMAEYYTGRIAGESVASAATTGGHRKVPMWHSVAEVSTPARRDARTTLFQAFTTNQGIQGNAWSRDGWSGVGRAHVHRTTVRQVESWTVLCRCEDINVDDVRMCVQQGARSPDDVKRMTRCGMGVCQWRECRTLVLEQMSALLNTPVDAIPLPNVRFPLRPVLLGALADSEEGDGIVRSVLSEVEEHE